MNYNKILKDIKKNEFKNIYLFYGEENYLIEDILKRLKVKLIDPSFHQLNFTLIKGGETSYDKIIDACETLPFMAEKKLVYIDGIDIFSGKSGPFSEKEERQFIEYISKIPESTILVFYGNMSVDGRKKIVKQIRKYGCVAEFSRLKEEGLNSWIISRFKILGRSIGPKELALFKSNLDYIGRNPSQSLFDVENEIKKLVSFMGEDIELKKDHIDKGMGSNFHNDIFNLLDAIEKRNFMEAIERLNIIVGKGEPILKILTTLGNQVKNILGAKLLMEERNYSSREIASTLGIHPFVASKCVTQSRQFTVGKLRELLNLFLHTDRAIKTGLMNEMLAMEMLILKMCH